MNWLWIIHNRFSYLLANERVIRLRLNPGNSVKTERILRERRPTMSFEGQGVDLGAIWLSSEKYTGWNFFFSLQIVEGRLLARDSQEKAEGLCRGSQAFSRQKIGEIQVCKGSLSTETNPTCDVRNRFLKQISYFSLFSSSFSTFPFPSSSARRVNNSTSTCR